MELAENEAQQDSGYNVATPRLVAIRLSNGRRVVGSVRVYRPEGRDRLSDYARGVSDVFRYVESPDGVFVVNSAHIVDLKETAA